MVQHSKLIEDSELLEKEAASPERSEDVSAVVAAVLERYLHHFRQRYPGLPTELIPHIKITAKLLVRHVVLRQIREGCTKEDIEKNITDRLFEKFDISCFRTLYRRNISKSAKEVRIGNKPTGSNQSSIVQEFAKFLERKGVADHEALALFDEFADQFPEMDAIGAVRELRGQAHAPDISQIPKYPGSRSGVDPIEFLLSHYKEAIDAGILGPGVLQRKDATLYFAVATKLKTIDPNLTIGDYLTSLRPEDKAGTIMARRFEACARILNLDEAEAARFLTTVSTERLLTSKRTGRTV